MRDLSIDLEGVDGEGGESFEGGEAGAEVVDGDEDAVALDVAELVVDGVEVVECL